MKREYETFAKINKSMPELAGPGKNPTVLQLAVDNINLALCDSRDLTVAQEITPVIKKLFNFLWKTKEIKSKEPDFIKIEKKVAHV